MANIAPSGNERRFIRHPTRVPIRYALDRPALSDVSDDESFDRNHLRNVSDGGVCFAAEQPVSPGAPIHLCIPLLGDDFEIDGSVAWCREVGRGYEVGVAFDSAQERFSVRMVEQLCYVEDYRTQVEREQGRTLSSEQAAAEWVERFAEDFPRLH
jgi:hypothetical protein